MTPEKALEMIKFALERFPTAADIGTAIFLTREDAEKALKERVPTDNAL